MASEGEEECHRCLWPEEGRGEGERFRGFVSIRCNMTRGRDLGRGIDPVEQRDVLGFWYPGGLTTGPGVMGLGAGKPCDSRSSQTGSDIRDCINLKNLGKMPHPRHTGSLGNSSSFSDGRVHSPCGS